MPKVSMICNGSKVRNSSPNSSGQCGDSAKTSSSAVDQTILLLSQQLGLAVIAEGVETQHQRDRLQALGCRFIQGFFYAHPMPLAELLLFLAGQAPAVQTVNRSAGRDASL